VKTRCLGYSLSSWALRGWGILFLESGVFLSQLVKFWNHVHSSASLFNPFKYQKSVLHIHAVCLFSGCPLYSSVLCRLAASMATTIRDAGMQGLAAPQARKAMTCTSFGKAYDRCNHFHL
jgi:hypothetical protein